MMSKTHECYHEAKAFESQEKLAEIEEEVGVSFSSLLSVLSSLGSVLVLGPGLFMLIQLQQIL